MTDTAPAKKPSMMDRIREFLDSLGAEEIEEVEAAPAEGAPAEGAPAEGAPAEGAPAEGAPAEGSGTTGAIEPGAAELDDLRAKIIEQAATIESQRNTIAELGGIDPTATAADEFDAEIEDDTPSEEDAIAAFDEDYAKQEAMLAELTKES